MSLAERVSQARVQRTEIPINEAERRKSEVAIMRAAEVMNWFIDYHRYGSEGLLRGVPGITMGIVAKGSEPVYINCGFADKETKRKMTEHTGVRGASLAKNVTATLASSLAEQGRVDMFRPVEEYLDGFTAISPKIHEVTLLHLLSHTAGMRRDGFTLYGPDAQYSTVADLRRLSRKIGFFVDYPGDEVKYSNAGFAYAGLALEAATGNSYAQLVQEEILDRLGMKNTYVDLTDEAQVSLASAYERRQQGGRKFSPTPTHAMAPAFGLITTTADWCEYMRSHFDGNKTVLSDIGKKLNQEVAGFDEGTGEAYGQGWQLFGLGAEESESNYVGHAGNLPGTSAHFRIDRESKIGVAVFANVMSAPVAALTEQMFSLIHFFRTEGEQLLKESEFKDDNPIDNGTYYDGLYAGNAGEILFLPMNNRLISFDFPAHSLSFDPRTAVTRYVVSIGREHEFDIDRQSIYGARGEELTFSVNEDGDAVSCLAGSYGGGARYDRIALNKEP